MTYRRFPASRSSSRIALTDADESKGMLNYKKGSALLATSLLKETGADRRLTEDGFTRIDPEWIAAGAGVMVMRRPLDKLLGAFVRGSTSGIIVNSQRPAGQTHLTCAHELGHYFLGHESTADEKIQYGNRAAKSEQEADWFAYGLLTSRSTIALAMRRKGWSVGVLHNPANLYQLSLRIGISYSAMAWTLVRLGLWNISDADRARKVEPGEIKRSLLPRGMFDPRAEVWLLDASDRDLVIEPCDNDQILVRLPNHAPSGYLWSADEIRGEGFNIQPLCSSSDQGSLIGSSFTDYLVGGPKNREERAGKPLPLPLHEQRPWETGNVAMQTYFTKIGFEASGEGLSTASKLAIIKCRGPR